MNVAGPIRQLIADDAAAFELLGDRVFPIIATQEAGYPLAVVRRLSVTPSPTHGEVSKTDKCMVEIRSIDPTAAKALDTDEAIRRAIDGKFANVVFLGETTVVDGIEYKTTVEDYDPTANVCIVVSNYSMRVKRTI